MDGRPVKMPDLEVTLEAGPAEDVLPSTSSRQCSVLKEFLYNSIQRLPRRSHPPPDAPSRHPRPRQRQLRSLSAESKNRVSMYPTGTELDPPPIPYMEKATLLESSKHPRRPFGGGKKSRKMSRSASVDTLLSDKQCRICHSGADSRRNPLIAPCRCNGTMKHVHLGCLIRWLEVSSLKFWPTNECELCGYRFKRHPVWRISGIRWPNSTYQDKVLNYLFLFLLLLMFVCGLIASKYSHDAEHSRFKTSRVVKLGNAFFSGDEIMVVVSGILFFFCFILALCTQYRAGGTIFRQCVRFWTINRNWQIKDYSPEADAQLTRNRRLQQLQEQRQRQVPHAQVSAVDVALLSVIAC